MRRSNSYFLIISIIIQFVFTNCSKNNKQLVNSADNILPLSVSNVWHLEDLNGRKMILRVISKAIFHNIESYKIMETAYVKSGDSLNRYYYLFHDEQNNIGKITMDLGKTIKDSSNQAYLWYKTNVDIGESWMVSNPSFSGDNTITQYRITLLSKTDTLYVMGKTFTNCYKYYIDDLYEADTEYYEWYAKGIGFLKRGFEPRPNEGYILKSIYLNKD